MTSIYPHKNTHDHMGRWLLKNELATGSFKGFVQVNMQFEGGQKHLNGSNLYATME